MCVVEAVFIDLKKVYIVEAVFADLVKVYIVEAVVIDLEKVYDTSWMLDVLCCLQTLGLQCCHLWFLLQFLTDRAAWESYLVYILDCFQLKIFECVKLVKLSSDS